MIDKNRVQKTKIARYEAAEAQKVIDAFRFDLKSPLESMEYFLNLYEDIYCKKNRLSTAAPLIGTMCIQVPEEIIRALGAVPVRLCNGFYVMEQKGSDFMPAKSCSLVKATLGMLSNFESPYEKNLSLIVHPTTCDQKTKAISLAEEMGYQMYHMEFPRVKESEESRRYWRASVRRFAKELQKLLGVKLKRSDLKESIKKIREAQKVYHEINGYRTLQNVPISGSEIFLMTNAFFFDDLERWTEAAKEVLKEVDSRANRNLSSCGKRSPRILYTGSPPIFPNLKLPMMIEQSDAIIVADETCSSNRLLNDFVSVDEWFLYDMVDAVADRYLKGCTCPIFTRNEDRIRRIKDLIATYKVDGVVYQSFAGCQVYEMERHSVMEALGKEGIPVLYIESDYSPAQGGQLLTRVEAFVESLKARRRKKK